MKVENKSFVASIVLFLAMFIAVQIFAIAAHAALKFDNNVEMTLKNQVLQDLSFMNQITGNTATPMHAKVFGEVRGSSYKTWFEKRVFEVGKNGCGSANAVACVITSFRNKIWFTPNYVKFSHPQIARLSVVYHEARHTETENGNWSHATCPTPFKNEQGQDVRSIWTNALLEGQAACDVTPFGSYGSQTILMKNIALKCTNCTDKVKADANLYAMDQLNRVIDKKANQAMRNDFANKMKF